MGAKSPGPKKRDGGVKPAATDAEKPEKRGRARRRFILEEVRNQGMVSDERIREEGDHSGFKAHPESLRQDAEEFEALGLPVRRVPGWFISETPEARKRTYDLRKDQMKPEKVAIGRLAAALLSAAKTVALRGEMQRQLLIDLQAEVDGHAQVKIGATFNKVKRLLEHYRGDCQSSADCQSVAEVLGDLERYAKETKVDGLRTNRAREAAERVKRFLEDYWSKRHRLAALDSGTTTEAIASELRSARQGIMARDNALRVLTNSPTIEQILELPDSPVDVIGVGGEIRKDTSARTGHLAEACLKAWADLQADVSIVGTTSLRFDGAGRPRAFCCDSEAEAMTKSMFLDLAGLKCVVMDSSKCERSSSSSFVFCPVDPARVHVVLTDEGILSNDKRKTCLDWFWQSGIVVFIATSLPARGQEAGSPQSPAAGEE